MNCPNISHPDWKVLISKEGEIEAINLYIKNGYDIPNQEDIEKLKQNLIENPIDRMESKDLQKLVKIKTQAYSDMVNKWKIFINKKKGKGEPIDKILENLEKSIETFTEADIKESLGIVFSNIRFTLNTLSKRLEGNPLTIDALRNAKDITNSFEILNDISDYVTKTKNINESDKSKTLHYISRLKVDIDKLNTIYNENIKEAIAKEYSKLSTIKRNQRRNQLEREYLDNNPRNKSDLKRDVYNERMREWVNTKITLENTSIVQSEEEYILELLETAPGDITNFTAHLIDPKNITQDHIIQLTVKLLEHKSAEIRIDYLKEKTKLVKKYEEFIKGEGKVISPTDQIKLYGDILERKDGKLTQEYTKPWKQEYMDAWKKTVELASSLDIKSERNKVYKEFFEKYTKITYNPKVKQDIKNPENIKGIYISDQYATLKNDPKRLDFYNFLIEFNREADKLVRGSGKQLRYRLPGVTAKMNENIQQNGLKETLATYYKDNTKVAKDDYEFGGEDAIKVLPTLGGKIYRTINIPFRQEVELKDQSFDLAGMALSNMYSAINYNKKNSVVSLVELTKDMMGERDVVKRDPSTLKKVVTAVKRNFNITDEEIEEIEQQTLDKGIKSNAYKLLNSIIEDRLYGISTIPGGEAFGLNIDKVSSFAMKVSGNNMLIANYSGGIANVIQGKVMNFLEGVGGNFYNRQNLRQGEKKYWTDVNNNLSDIGKEQVESKTNTLLYLFLGDAIGDDGFANDLTKDSTFKRVFNSKNLHAINHIAENYIQGTAMFSYLDTFKVKNDNGDYIDIDGNVVDKDKAATLDDVLEFNNGIISLNPKFIIEGYENIKDNKKDNIKRVDHIVKDISIKFREVVKDMHGNYSAENKSMIQRYWYGKLLLFMRKYLIPGVQRRYKGLQFVKTSRQDIPLHYQGYSEALEKEKEGTYTTLVRFMYELKKHSDKLSTELISTNWNNLTDYEKGNIRQAIIELGLMVSSLIASTLLAKLAEDEDDHEGIYAMAYFSRRLWGEQMFYTPLALISGETTRILESPTATLSTMKRLGTTIDALIEDAVNLEFQTYQSGKRKGQYKSLVNLNNLLNPIWKQTVDLSYKDKLGFLKNNF